MHIMDIFSELIQKKSLKAYDITNYINVKHGRQEFSHFQETM